VCEVIDVSGRQRAELQLSAQIIDRLGGRPVLGDPFPAVGIVGTCSDRPLFERAAAVRR
jgi:hypothetical protein